ncbi:hypothetical protein AVEN_256458-1 [Araneus ventricosus]|uniref:Uncharacterized protein n=1 Tax=Araneus ventricosus TaxID=182803 RepID=A0A4Y2X7F3_ARAVE|nr:hypothetical protein AVEN_256458-1 [Araneus ventricosus]
MLGFYSVDFQQPHAASRVDNNYLSLLITIPFGTERFHKRAKHLIMSLYKDERTERVPWRIQIMTRCGERRAIVGDMLFAHLTPITYQVTTKWR